MEKKHIFSNFPGKICLTLLQNSGKLRENHFLIAVWTLEFYRAWFNQQQLRWVFPSDNIEIFAYLPIKTILFSSPDIDECQSRYTNRCSQKCVNTIGSYVCACDPGYLLGVDKRTCYGKRMYRQINSHFQGNIQINTSRIFSVLRAKKVENSNKCAFAITFNQI